MNIESIVRCALDLMIVGWIIYLTIRVDALAREEEDHG